MKRLEMKAVSKFIALTASALLLIGSSHGQRYDDSNDDYQGSLASSADRSIMDMVKSFPYLSEVIIIGSLEDITIKFRS